MKCLVRYAGPQNEWSIVECEDELDGARVFGKRRMQESDIAFIETVLFFGSSVPPKEILDAGERSGDLVVTLWRFEKLESGGYKSNLATKEDMHAELERAIRDPRPRRPL